jgi:hypothetical protein
MGSAICGGLMTWTQFIHQSPDDMMGTLMCKIRKRVIFRGRYRFKIIDPLGDCWYWEDEVR